MNSVKFVYKIAPIIKISSPTNFPDKHSLVSENYSELAFQVLVLFL